jgi:membrane protease YdiL (CAAX protease family)
LILLISAVSLVGLALTRSGRPPSAPEASGKLGVYLPMMVVPWLLTFYVVRVGREPRAHRSLASLTGRRWDTWARAAADLALAILVALAILGCERALAPPVDAARAGVLAAMLPRALIERVAWLLVAFSVGFGEEVVYRGYLQTQLGALTRRPWLGVLLQALLFGVAHLDQGPASAVRVALYGLLFGVLVRARQSLVPAVIAHVLVDAASAFR